MSGSGQKRASSEDELKTAKSITDKESGETSDSLNRSKGRGQLTATAALSVTNITLLKSILDRGPINNKYYEVSLTLVCVSLGLQIMAGFCSLVLDQTMSFLNKYGSSSNFSEFWCPCRCVRKDGKDHDHYDAETGTETKRSLDFDGDLADLFEWEKSGHVDDAAHIVANAREEPCCDCLPYMVTTEVYSYHEIQTMEKYNVWRLNLLSNQLKATRAEDELEYQTELMKDIRKQMKEIEEDQNPVASSSERITQLQAKLVKAKDSKAKFERALKAHELAKDQGKMLREYTEAITKNRVLKFSSYWQQQLNYLFYVIFILNTFITGFGISDGTSYPGAPMPAANITTADQ